MADIDALNAYVAAWPASPTISLPSATPGCVRRLVDALHWAVEAPDSVGPSDLAALVGQVLRREHYVHGGKTSLRVPRQPPWPTKGEWAANGCEVTELGADRLLVMATDWQPEWLPSESEHPLAQAAIGCDHADGLRRSPVHVHGDGFLSPVGLKQYRSPGQRQAVRTVLASRPGATILVNLPTGTGKSLVAHLPALLWTENGGVALIVVPTTALALDQERAVLAYPMNLGAMPERLAYYEGQQEAEREAIRQRIRSGQQRILFTSPESLVGSLAPTVYRAAENGWLRLLAIDEAHLVSQWGTEFRPEFQALSGFRRALLRAATTAQRPAFRTLLLSATLTEEDYATLHTLFGTPGPFEHVAAVVLRPEPSYWIARCDDETTRRERLLEAVRHLPRPMVIYASAPDDAITYGRLLRDHGIRRVGIVHGKTPPDERSRVIHAWRGDELDARGVARTIADVVVATSAFGLGVDQSDVRSVLHVCVPETIDRYYQEVGRGGRDGKACISLVLWADGDKAAARNLNRRRVIGTKLGFPRWEKMFSGRRILNAADQVFRVSLDAVPPHLTTEESARNRAWNVRTLALMARAGLLEFDSEMPPRPSPDESPEAWEQRCRQAFADFRASSVIRLLDAEAMDRARWEAACGSAKSLSLAADQARFRAMMEALAGNAELGDLLARIYRVRCCLPGDAEPVDVIPQSSCGGCPECRRNKRTPFEGIAPSPPPVRFPLTRISDPLGRLLDGRSWLLVTTPAKWTRADWGREVVRAIDRLVKHGIANVVAPSEVLEDREIQRCYRFVPERAVFLLEPSDPMPPSLPTVCVVAPSVAPVTVPAAAFFERDPQAPWIILSPEDAQDPEYPTARVSDVRSPRIALSLLMTKI